jgi:hypothetical protein
MSAILVKVQGYDTYVDIVSGRTVLDIIGAKLPMPGDETKQEYKIITRHGRDDYTVLATYPTLSEARDHMGGLMKSIVMQTLQYSEGVIIPTYFLPEVKK